MCEHLDLMHALLVEGTDPQFRDRLNRYMTTGEFDAAPAEEDQAPTARERVLTGPSRWNRDTWGMTPEAQAELAVATNRGRMTLPADAAPVPPPDEIRQAAMDAARAAALANGES